MARRTPRSRRVFLLSGLTDNEREDIGKKIRSLGGDYIETEVFQTNCTHVVCGKLSRGEKFLGACAMGKWILVPDYVTASVNAKRWVDEEKYEWSLNWSTKGNYSGDILSAPIRCRKSVIANGKGPFFNWKVAVVVESVRRRTVYKRLLEIGGAKVYKLPPLKETRHKLLSFLTHVFISLENRATLNSLVREGFPCFTPNYIGDFLISGYGQTTEPTSKTRKAETKPLAVEQMNVQKKKEYTIKSQKPPIQRTSVNELKKQGARQSHLGRENQDMCRKDAPPVRRSSRPSTSQYKRGAALSQGTMDKFCFSSPRSKSSVPFWSSPLERSDNISTPSSSSKKSSGLCNSGSSLDLSQESSKFSCNVRQSCGDMFGSSQTASLSSTQTCGIHSSGVSPRLSPLIDCVPQRGRLNATSKSPVRPVSLISNTVIDKSLKVIKSEPQKINIDTSDCFISSFQVLGGVNYGKCEGPKSISSTDSMKPVLGSAASDLASVSEASSKRSDSAYSCVSDPIDQGIQNTTMRRRSSRLRARSITPSSEVSTDLKSREKMAAHHSKRRSAQQLQKSSSTQRQSAGLNSSSPLSFVSDKTTSSSNLLIPDSLSDGSFNQEETSRSSRGFSNWSSIRGDSSSANGSNLTTYSTSPSCFLTENESQKSSRKRAKTCTDSVLHPHHSGKAPIQTISGHGSQFFSPCLNREAFPREKPDLLPSRRVLKTPSIDKLVAVNPGERSRDVRQKYFPRPSDLSTTIDSKEVSSSEKSPKLPQKEVCSEDTPSDLSLRPAIKAIKRRIILERDLSHSAKRQKLFQDPSSWRPSSFGVRSRPPAPTVCSVSLSKRLRRPSVAMAMSTAAAGLVETLLEENYMKSAQDLLFSLHSRKTYPRPKLLHDVMTRLLRNAETEDQAYRSYVYLRSILSEHPPDPDRPALRATYLQSLQPDGKEEGHTGAAREFFTDLFRSLLWPAEVHTAETEQEEKNTLLLLQYLVAVMETDLNNTITSKNGSKVIQKDIRNTLIGRMLWPGTQQITVNKHCKEILEFFACGLNLLKTDENKVLINDLLLNVISMVAACLRLVDKTSDFMGDLLSGERVSSLFCEIARIVGAMSESVLSYALGRLSPKWLGLGVCQLLLDAMDDGLLSDVEQPGELTLKRIVTFDMYLLPPLKGLRSPCKYNSPLMTPSKGKESLKSQHPVTFAERTPTMTPRTQRRLAGVVNKPNNRGVTVLYTACKRNNMAKVRELLSVPGIDVNVRDPKTGCSPLHEAVKNGNVRCVTDLLKFRPARTISSYFGGGSSQPSGRINMQQANLDGLTPLHLAVMSNQMEIAQTLLQYGGYKLLEAESANGDTPLSLCPNEEMRAVLTMPNMDVMSTPRKMRHFLNMSQTSQDSQNSFLFSQSSPSKESGDCQPSTEMYERVLGDGPTRQHCSLEDCLRYMCVLQNTMRLYITTYQLQRALFLMLSEHNLEKDETKCYSGRCFSVENSPSKNPQGVSPVDKTVSAQLSKDLKIYRSLGKYLEGFRHHLKQICRQEDYAELKSKLKLWILLCP